MTAEITCTNKCHPKWLVRNTKQMKPQTHETDTAFQYIASDELMRRAIPCERENKCSRGRYGQRVNERWIVTLCPSLFWPEVLPWRACPLKQRGSEDHTLLPPKLWAPILAVGAASPVHCRAPLQAAAPGSPRDRAHSLQKCHEATVPDQCCRPAQWQSSFLPVLLWHGQEQLHCCRANCFKRQE